MTYLLDANALAALVIPQHEHHARAHAFFLAPRFRHYSADAIGAFANLKQTAQDRRSDFPPLHTAPEAVRLMRLLSHRRGVRFLPADIDCSGAMPFGTVTGHRQWNDFTSLHSLTNTH